jgi:hypothetical protein
MDYTIPVGTILYTGGFDSLPTDPTHYHFFTKNIEVAKQIASLKKNKTVLTFEVITPIKVHLQEIPSSKYYFDTAQDYASTEAQELCKNGYSGYASKDPKYEIEDIGLCDSKNLLKQLPTTGTSRRRKIRRSKRKLRKTHRK